MTDSAVLNHNLAALAARGVLMPDAMGDGAEVRLDAGPGDEVLSLRTADGRWVRMHSQRHPLAEAERVIAPAFESGDPALLIVIGLGLGYVLDAIEQRSSRTKVLAIEPVPASLPHMLSRRDWSAWLADNRLRLLVGPDYAGSSDAWKEFDAEAAIPPIVVHPVLAREAGAEVLRAREMVERIAFGAQANLSARKRFAGRYLLNTLKNLPIIWREGNAGALFGAFAGVPAIIASAGPSLDKNIEDLRQVPDRTLLIAVDTALRPLLGAGIDPHLVVSVDPSEANARHLVNLPDPGRTWLVAEGSLDPIVFTQFQDRTFIFKVSSHHPWPWLQRLGIERDSLRAWGSVATSAFDLALKMGCDPIIFVGQDLAYTGGRPYCRGTTYEEDWAARVGEGEELPDIWAHARAYGGMLTVDDVSGQGAVTKPSLVAFRDWIAEQAALLDRRTVINATGAGILEGPSIRQADLGSVLASLPPLPPPDARVREGWSRTKAVTAADVKKTAPQLLEAFRRAIRGEELTTWASFANTTADALSAELDGVAATLEGQLHGAQQRRPTASTVMSSYLDPHRRAVVQPPELVRAYRALLRGEETPEWARAAAATIDPLDAPAFWKAVDRMPPGALQNAATHCDGGGAWEHAAALLARLSQKLEQEDPARARVATLDRFRCLFLAGCFESARSLGETLLPDEFPVLYLSMIYQMVCDHAQAVAKLERLLADYPDVRELRLSLAVRLAMSGNLRDALELVDADATRWPGRVEPQYARGVCLRVHGDHEAATEALAAIADDWSYAAPELVIASVATRRPEAIEHALCTARRSLPNPVVAFVMVPVDQAAIVDEALARLGDELATAHHHVDVSRLSPIAVRLLTQAENAWKPKWRA